MLKYALTYVLLFAAALAVYETHGFEQPVLKNCTLKPPATISSSVMKGRVLNVSAVTNCLIYSNDSQGALKKIYAFIEEDLQKDLREPATLLTNIVTPQYGVTPFRQDSPMGIAYDVKPIGKKDEKLFADGRTFLSTQTDSNGRERVVVAFKSSRIHCSATGLEAAACWTKEINGRTEYIELEPGVIEFRIVSHVVVERPPWWTKLIEVPMTSRVKSNSIETLETKNNLTLERWVKLGYLRENK